MRSFIRGAPAAVPEVHLVQYYNPSGRPDLRFAFESDPANRGEVFKRPSNATLQVLEFKAGSLNDEGFFSDRCTLSTDSSGLAVFTIRGKTPGTTRVAMTTCPDDLPLGGAEDDAFACYDNDDALGYWSAVGSFSARVLPDLWHLLDVPPEQVDYDFLYTEFHAR
ncbi:hypothetical protein C2W62_33655 [Candidatus Entotheonella serta]|nr:hypothetical protein C2W62_33655 [Candidatus Entotheonella serta]